MIAINKVLNDIVKGLQFELNESTSKLELVCTKKHNYKNLFPCGVLVHDNFLIGLAGPNNDCLYIISTSNIAFPDKNMKLLPIAAEAIDGSSITIMNNVYPMFKSEEEYFQYSLIEKISISYEDIEIINELKVHIKEALNL